MGLFDRYLNTVGRFELPSGDTIPLVNWRNPLDVRGLMTAILGGVWTAVATGYVETIESVFRSITSPFTGFFSFVQDVFGSLVAGGEFAALFGTAYRSLAPLGTFRPLAVVGISLLSLWVAARLTQFVLGEVSL